MPSALRRKGLFPAGRLDKDTTGFVLLTDDGAFAHRILSPRSHIPKTYIATLDKPVPPTAAAAFAGGMEMDGKVLQPAQLTILSADPPRAQVVLRQGIYHQVKRMFARVGCTVTALHRTAMGALKLDPTLAPGDCRALTPAEVALLAKDTVQ